jgi:hypothetical protein
MIAETKKNVKMLLYENWKKNPTARKQHAIKALRVQRERKKKQSDA